MEPLLLYSRPDCSHAIQGLVLWIEGKQDLFMAGLIGVGLDPCRLVLAETRQDALVVMEEGLRHPDLAGVV